MCSFAGGKNTKSKPHDEDETGSLSVILVVILPVAQMILVLIVILLLRICYKKFCTSSKPSSDPSLNYNKEKELRADERPSIATERY